MNKEQFKGNWREVKGQLKQKWGKLTDDDLMQIDGKYEQFLGMLQKRYGYKKEQAEEEFHKWCKECDRSCKSCDDRDETNRHDRRKAG